MTGQYGMRRDLPISSALPGESRFDTGRTFARCIARQVTALTIALSAALLMSRTTELAGGDLGYPQTCRISAGNALTGRTVSLVSEKGLQLSMLQWQLHRVEPSQWRRPQRIVLFFNL
ncbi:hypothetical protein C8J57DRAFT_1244274 [Mycena rebaudengoi]|nr:hypothetical protein C8J57DRAFT_1244274 [Mycena rebaudengoi]